MSYTDIVPVISPKGRAFLSGVQNQPPEEVQQHAQTAQLNGLLSFDDAMAIAEAAKKLTGAGQTQAPPPGNVMSELKAKIQAALSGQQAPMLPQGMPQQGMPQQGMPPQQPPMDPRMMAGLGAMPVDNVGTPSMASGGIVAFSGPEGSLVEGAAEYRADPFFLRSMWENRNTEEENLQNELAAYAERRQRGETFNPTEIEQIRSLESRLNPPPPSATPGAPAVPGPAASGASAPTQGVLPPLPLPEYSTNTNVGMGAASQSPGGASAGIQNIVDKMLAERQTGAPPMPSAGGSSGTNFSPEVQAYMKSQMAVKDPGEYDAVAARKELEGTDRAKQFQDRLAVLQGRSQDLDKDSAQARKLALSRAFFKMAEAGATAKKGFSGFLGAASAGGSDYAGSIAAIKDKYDEQRDNLADKQFMMQQAQQDYNDNQDEKSYNRWRSRVQDYNESRKSAVETGLKMQDLSLQGQSLGLQGRGIDIQQQQLAQQGDTAYYSRLTDAGKLLNDANSAKSMSGYYEAQTRKDEIKRVLGEKIVSDRSNQFDIRQQAAAATDPAKRKQLEDLAKLLDKRIENNYETYRNLDLSALNTGAKVDLLALKQIQEDPAYRHLVFVRDNPEAEPNDRAEAERKIRELEAQADISQSGFSGSGGGGGSELPVLQPSDLMGDSAEPY